ncbi:MAG: hypothetical protein FD180_4106 [Planctomycetota bacterium]|nr:MAG: hypothetical protein FD180_4106 [Planctomycetota bacterium]
MRNRIPLIAAAAAAAVFGACLPASAHEKWFCTHERIAELTAQARPDVFTTINPTLSAVFALSGAAVVALLFLDLRLRRRRAGERLCRWLLGLRHAVAPALGITTGVVLVWAALHGEFFAHDLSLSSVEPAWLVTALRGAQLLLGASLILGLATRWAALALLVAFLPSVALFGFRSWVDYVDVVGVCLFLMIAGRGAFSLDRAFGLRAEPLPGLDRWAHPILRVFVGIDLLVLGVNDKFFNPNIAIAVTGDHGLNFLAGAGVSDGVFVLLAAAVETSVGALIALGILARPVAAVLLGLLTLTLFVFGPLELVGHLPIFAAALAILATGTGGKLALPGVFLEEDPARVDAAPALAA